MSGLIKAVFGNGESTSNTTVTTPPMSDEEKQLVQLNTQLAQRQLQNMDQLQPFQQKLLQMSMDDLDQQAATSKALNAAVTPEQQASLAKQDYDRALRMGPVQEQLLQAQMDAMQGKVTPEQQKAIDAAVAAGSADIDTSTQKGIGLIADELANSRGLRMTDTPILREATLLARSGQEQKANLSRNIRATGMINMPQLSSGIAMGQQTLADAAAQFQADLRQRAYQNRLALTGQTSSSGIGLAGVGSGVGSSTLGTLAGARTANRTVNGSAFDPASVINSYGNLARGIGQAGAGLK